MGLHDCSGRYKVSVIVCPCSESCALERAESYVARVCVCVRFLLYAAYGLQSLCMRHGVHRVVRAFVFGIR